MRRKPGALLPLEVDILDVTAAQHDPVHGFELARQLAEARDAKSLTAHGTLYKALGRLAEQGLLEDEWEAPEIALRAGRPRRRLYRISGAGERRLAEERRRVPAPTRREAFA